MAKGGRKRNSASGRPWISVAAFIAGVLVFFLFLRYFQTLKAPGPPEVAKKVEEKEVPVAPEKPKAPRVAIVIDDMGQDPDKLKEILEVDSPITVAVLPRLKHSGEVATKAHSKGREVILHLPMEPRNSTDHDPGEGALLTGMTGKEVVENMEKDLSSVPHAKGINNHMGSKFTENEKLMRTVLEVARERNLFFLDSRTSGGSIALRLAKEMGVRSAGRSVFLDNVREKGYIKGQLGELVEMARKNGSAVAIGHPYPETLEVLKEEVPRMEETGVDVVNLSELVE